MERTRLRGAPNTASAGPIAVSIRLSNARLRVRGTADFARRIHSRIRIGPERPREGAIDATIRKQSAVQSYSPATPLLAGEGWCVGRRQRRLDASAQAHRRRIAQRRV